MFTSPKRILWPTDFSSLSLWGARTARGLCDVFGARLHVVHVILPTLTPELSATLPVEVPVSYSEPDLRDACCTRLAELVAREFGSAERVASEVLFGNPWSAICKYVEDSDIDLVVVATHGRTGLPHVVIGSTAERIVQHAPCPVLVVKAPREQPEADV